MSVIIFMTKQKVNLEEPKSSQILVICLVITLIKKFIVILGTADSVQNSTLSSLKDGKTNLGVIFTYLFVTMNDRDTPNSVLLIV